MKLTVTITRNYAEGGYDYKIEGEGETADIQDWMVPGDLDEHLRDECSTPGEALQAVAESIDTAIMTIGLSTLEKPEGTNGA